MYKKIQIFLEHHHMIEKGDRVIVGLSGGADSVCLLLLLDKLSGVLGFSVMAVHVEHGIRGEESLRDAKFCEQLCQNRGILFIQYAVDAVRCAEESRQSLEEAARQLRYECFRKALQQYQADKIAVAHHANDNAETILFHLARGTGIRGLCGIAPVTEYQVSTRDLHLRHGGPACDEGGMADSCTIIRPLLCVCREEIEEWLSKQGQSYCTDSTNTDQSYSRNRIRSQILPEMLQINSGAVEHMQRMASGLMEISAFLDETARQRGRDCFEMIRGGDGADQISIDCKKFLALPSVLQQNLMHQLIGMAAGQKKDISAIHVEQVIRLFSSGTGKRIVLPYQIQAEKSYEKVLLKKSVRAQKISKSIDLQIPGETFWDEYISIRSKVIDFDGNFPEIPKNRYTKWFDYDKIKFTVQLRCRQTGDFLSIQPNGGHKKLKNWFIDEKIPQAERDEVLLLADGSHIIWVIGYRMSEVYKITPETKRVLVVTLCRKQMEEDIQ